MLAPTGQKAEELRAKTEALAATLRQVIDGRVREDQIVTRSDSAVALSNLHKAKAKSPAQLKITLELALDLALDRVEHAPLLAPARRRRHPSRRSRRAACRL